MGMSNLRKKSRRPNRLKIISDGLFRTQGGAVSVILAFALTALLGMGALAIDLGRAWNLSTELQNAADAGALACASQLDRKANALARARSAATGTLVQNTQIFATDGAGRDVKINTTDIVFLEDLVTRTVATTDAAARYCQVTISPRRVDFSFAQIIGAPPSASPLAVAVAGLDVAKCEVPPILICNPDDPLPFNLAAHIGDGITLKDSKGGGLSPGNFGLLALPGKILSVNAIRDAFARTHPLNQCYGTTVDTKPGQSTAMSQGLNMRFDVYSQATHKVPPGEPKVRSNPFYVPAMNNVKGLVKGGANCSYTSPTGWNDPAVKYTGPGNPAPSSMGFPRDNCAYNGGWCDTGTGGVNMGDGAWDSTAYMTTNHAVGIGAVPNLDSEPAISRYEVYRWELDSPSMPTGEPEPDPLVSTCHAAPVQTVPDRRVMTVAVMDCSKISGTTTIEPDAWVQLFLTEPMGVFNGNNDLYAEVIGPADPVGGGVTRHVLHLVE